jgi:hypothetical protein
MKKFVFLAVLILAAGLCFAQNDGKTKAPAPPKPEKFSLEVTLGVPIHWTNSPLKHQSISLAVTPTPPPSTSTTSKIDTDKTVTANTAIGAALLFNYSRLVGFTVDMDFFFGSDIMGSSHTDSYTSSFFGANVFIGPIIYMYYWNFLRIPLGFGIHVNYWSSEYWTASFGNADASLVKATDLQVGPGFYLGIQFHFNNSLYIFSRTNVAIDLFRWHEFTYSGGASSSPVKETQTHDAEFIVAWQIKPTIGVGIKF